MAEIPSSHGSLGGGDEVDGRDREATQGGGASDGFDSDEFRAWMRQRRGRASRRAVVDDSDDEERPKGKGSGGAPPEWDGVTTPFQDWLVKVRLWTATTRTKGRHQGPMILQRLSGQPFQAFKHWAKDLGWLKSDDGAETLLSVMDSAEFYGDDQEEELLTCLSRLTFHLRREKGEECRVFFRRWDEAHRKVKDEHKVILPDRYLGFLLVNALQLSEVEIKSMMAFTRGSLTVKDVKEFVRKHEIKLLTKDVGLEKKDRTRTSTATTSNAVHHVQESDGSEQQEDELYAVEEALQDLRGDDEAVETNGDYNGDNENLLEEHEAAEVLSTMLNQQRKSKTFMQSMKLKKARELSRGFSNWRRDGKDKGKGRSKTAIEDLKAVTKCAICKKPGHWHRECPEKGSAKDRDRNKELHYMQRDDDGECSEAAFCGMLERESDNGYGATASYDVDERLTDRKEKSAAEIPLPPGLDDGDRLRGGHREGDDHGAHGGNDDPHPGERRVSMTEPTEQEFSGQSGHGEIFGAYKDHVDATNHESGHEHEIMWNESHGNPGNSVARDRGLNVEAPINEDYCATIDTGCERMAIGQETLNRLIPHVPKPLQVMSIPQEHRFKSVHGKSVTNRVAAIPTGLGHAGSTLRPAIFNEAYSKGAPFLISLPFLLYCRSILHLDPQGQLRIHFRRFRFSALCHLGPTGSLRLRLDQFDSHKMSMLATAQREFQEGGTEFEVYRTAASPNKAPSEEEVRNAPQHGCDEPEQESPAVRRDRPGADASMATNYPQDLVPGHRDCRAHDRTTTTQAHPGGDALPSSSSFQRVRTTGSSTGQSLGSSLVMEPCGDGHTSGDVGTRGGRDTARRELRRGQGPEDSGYGGDGTGMPTQHALHPIPDAEARTESQQVVLAMSEIHPQAMRDLHMVGSPTVVAGQQREGITGQHLLRLPGQQREDVAKQHLFHAG